MKLSDSDIWKITITFMVAFLLTTLAGCIYHAFASDRCKQFVHEARTQHFKYFGLNFPYWYGVGQLKQESGCRVDLTAFDGGKGIAQFMPTVEKYCETYLGELDMYNPHHAIKAQAWYMSKLNKQNWDGRLFLTYMFYNSGYGTVKKESQKAGITDYEKMKTVCSRKILTLKSGKLLDLCDVGYMYPIHIFRYGQIYKKGKDRWAFWE